MLQSFQSHPDRKDKRTVEGLLVTLASCLPNLLLQSLRNNLKPSSKRTCELESTSKIVKIPKNIKAQVDAI